MKADRRLSGDLIFLCYHCGGLSCSERTEVDASSQIERTPVGGKAAELRTRREARYNRAVVPWWWTDCNPGDSHCGGIQKPLNLIYRWTQSLCFYMYMLEVLSGLVRGWNTADSRAWTGGKARGM